MKTGEGKKRKRGQRNQTKNKKNSNILDGGCAWQLETDCDGGWFRGGCQVFSSLLTTCLFTLVW
jgi:hypothetical protein